MGNILTLFVHGAPLISCEPLDYERRHLMSLRQGTVAGDSYLWGTARRHADHALTKVSPPELVGMR